MSKQLELLSRPVNFAVVQLPERQFPGVVIQGDSLNGLVRQLQKIHGALSAEGFETLVAEIEDVQEQLSSALHHYEAVCAERGIALPYVNQDL